MRNKPPGISTMSGYASSLADTFRWIGLSVCSMPLPTHLMSIPETKVSCVDPGELLFRFVLEQYVDGLNNFHLGVLFAIDYHLVLAGLRPCGVSEMLLRETVVPTAIPRREIIGVLLERA